MNNQKNNWILYLIITTIIATITIQFYWNYKNYEQNKQRVINEIQISLDNSIEVYYADLSKQNFFAIVEESATKLDNEKDTVSFQITSLSLDIDHVKSKKEQTILVDSLFNNANKKIKLSYKDSSQKKKSFSKTITQFSKNNKKGIHVKRFSDSPKLNFFKGRKAKDSLKLIRSLNTIWISLQNDSINYNQIDSIFTKELKNKGITSRYSFKHFKNDSLLFDNSNNKLKSFLKAEAKSTYFKPSEKFLLNYSNPTYEALKRSFTGILLSLLLSLAVISSLIYLLKIINQQKELAEIKNDLISNITHEFKTPITTVSTAIEAINSFNIIDDKEKTKKYLSISAIQLKKLHQMVEKLLETATLDSEKLLLKKEVINIIDLVEKITRKHQLIAPEKNIYFSSNVSSLEREIDSFHFENAISNLIDNAIKYGGNKIEININSLLNNLEISIADNGLGIDKNQQEKIFEKFYRVPKGNTHDVKGFGIGLYYTKKIIEKHNGLISLTTNFKQTVFKISLPND